LHSKEVDMTDRSWPSVRGLVPATLAACLTIAFSATVASAADEPSPASLATPDPSASAPLLAPGSLDTGSPFPDVLGDPSDLPTVSIEPASDVGWTVGVPRPYALGHCGILSPVDVDGSLWAPLGGTDATGGPIDGDQEIGELVNGTSGTLELTTTDQALFTTDTGQRLYFGRAPGPLDYFLCM
jgi:hypothetical protein